MVEEEPPAECRHSAGEADSWEAWQDSWEAWEPFLAEPQASPQAGQQEPEFAQA